MFDNFWNFQGGGGVTVSSLKWKIQRGGGVLYDIPSVVGVWIFSGTTHFGCLFVSHSGKLRFFMCIVSFFVDKPPK